MNILGDNKQPGNTGAPRRARLTQPSEQAGGGSTQDTLESLGLAAGSSQRSGARRAASREHINESTRNAKITRIIVAAIVAVVFLGAFLFVGRGIYNGLASHFGWGVTLDYEGAGEGEVVVSVSRGDTGTDIAGKLAAEDVVKTSEGFVKYLLKEHPEAVFDVGAYRLKHKMSPAAAYEALQDPANKVDLTVTLPEGISADQAFERFAEVTGIPVSDFESAAKNYQALGVPAEFPSIEGFMFPATYELAGDEEAADILKKTVDRMWQALDEHGVKKEDAFKILTMAALVQREAGSNTEDFPKIARVFYNRLEQNMNLQSDASVAYGTGRTHTVWTEPEERADASNKYNTYANPGLPAGPIGLPGDVAIAAALQPASGEWLYFVPINLETGETAFAKTAQEHEKNTDRLAQWCTKHRAAGGIRCD